MNQFAENLKSLMKKNHLTAKAVGEATGIPASTLSEWINGDRLPTLSESVLRLAKFLNVSLEFLLTGKEAEESLLHEIISNINDDGFVSIHKGIYRITVEKFTGKERK